MDSNLAIVVVALISFGGVVGVPYLTGKQRSADKREDWRRQDEVAAAVAKATKAQARDSAETQAKLKEIHFLVNSSMTNQIQATLDQTKLTLVSLQELVDDKKSRGVSPTKAAMEAIAGTEAKIVELEKVVLERRAADAIAVKEAAAAGAASAGPIEVVIANPADNPVPIKDVTA